MKFLLFAHAILTSVVPLLSSLHAVEAVDLNGLIQNLTPKCLTGILKLGADATLDNCMSMGGMATLFTAEGDQTTLFSEVLKTHLCPNDCTSILKSALDVLYDDCSTDIGNTSFTNLPRTAVYFFKNYRYYRDLYCLQEDNTTSTYCSVQFLRRRAEIVGDVADATNSYEFFTNQTVQDAQFNLMFEKDQDFMCGRCMESFYTVIYNKSTTPMEGWGNTTAQTLFPSVCGSKFLDAKFPDGILNGTTGEAAYVDPNATATDVSSDSVISIHLGTEPAVLLAGSALLVAGFATLL
ncbi:hypothetical protein IE53DRAFT_78611 [Violaceomyces palustris]|uniref:Uncharacterized protein n=1 Tax=Violaceomyces palustris TaxID=1673888 RepID=A0ACD0NYE2_9BASI|nr:hypothetical protein IE53DRAFT_78611 [Violaceomyces palustris]